MTAGSAIAAALLAALLFGASTPFAKVLVGDVSPTLLAGLLYLGSGLGLWAIRLLRARGRAVPHLPLQEWPWLLGAIAAGGVVAPVLLMYGLTQTSASSASLLLNLETTLTALIAWVVFRENADARIVLGVVLIVAGGAVLAWTQAQIGQSTLRGAAFIAAACLFWAVDNNLTRKVSSHYGARRCWLRLCCAARLVATGITLSSRGFAIAPPRYRRLMPTWQWSTTRPPNAGITSTKIRSDPYERHSASP